MDKLASLPVAVVGGGPVGMFSAILLARCGLRCVLFERAPSRYFESAKSASTKLPHPKAHVLHTRTMELFRQVGMEEAIWSKVPPVQDWLRFKCRKHFRYCTALTGSTLAKVDHFDTPEYRCLREASPCRISQFSQPLLEEVLYKEITTNDKCLELVDMRFQRAYRSMKVNDSGAINLTVDNVESGEGEAISCSHVIAADGAYSSVREDLDVGMSGERDLEAFASIHFTSTALGKYLLAVDNGAMLTFVFNSNTIAVVVAHDIRKGDFVIHVPFFPPMQTAKDFEDPKVARRVIDVCIASSGAHDVSYKLESVKAWGMHATRADSFSMLGNKVFLVGDAAHQFPPSGGFGVNTGFIDAHNLVWKLAVTKNQSRHSQANILASYETERKPVCEAAINVAVDNYRRGLLPAKVLGLDRGMLASLLSVVDASNTRTQWLFGHVLSFGLRQVSLVESGFMKRRVADLVRVVEEDAEALPLLFPEVDLGYSYKTTRDSQVQQVDDVLIWKDPVERLQRDEMQVRNSLVVGGMLPHIYTEDLSNGKMVSTLDICSYGSRYVFISSHIDAIKSVNTNEVAKVLLAPRSDGIRGLGEVRLLRDTDGRWRELEKQQSCFGVLVRPDQHIELAFSSLEEICSHFDNY